MRKCVLLFLLALGPPLFAQTNGSITSTQSVCIGVSNEHSTVGIQVTGTWTGTLQPQVAIQGQALTNSQVVPSTSTTPASTITGNGVFYAHVGAASQFCILGNTVASGTAIVYLNVSKGVNTSTLGGGGSGSGTVSANSGSAGALATYAAAGGSTTVGPDTGLSSNAAGTLSVGAVGVGTGSLSFKGTTSGTQTVTCTGPTCGALDTSGPLFIGGNSAVGATSGLIAGGVQSGGTKFATNAGCAETATLGGATAGKYNSGTSGTCTLIITFGNALSSTNGWSCTVHDLTTPADVQNQTATTTTTVTFSGTTVSGDVINFNCFGY